MRPILTALILLAFLPSVPTVAATPSCAAVTEPHPGVPVPNVGLFYVVPSTSDPEVWHESNGVDGLQRVACRDATGVDRPADFRNAAFHVPQEDELPCRLQGRMLVCFG